MIGNLRESFQRNCSIHHSWNRGTAIHGVHYLRMEHNFLYNIMGHTVFIEDGVEEYNQVIGNLGIKTIPSMSLLNTDQTPAVFWIVTGANYIIQNHAVASRRYGFWFRPEISATGTSANTPGEHVPAMGAACDCCCNSVEGPSFRLVLSVTFSLYADPTLLLSAQTCIRSTYHCWREASMETRLIPMGNTV